MSRVGVPLNDQAPNATLVPARIVNEHVYCPRLAWLEWEARAFEDSDDTVDGRHQHRNVDRPRGEMKAGLSQEVDTGPEDDEWPFGEPLAGKVDKVLTALTLASEELGVVAKLDRVEIRGAHAISVETKRGRPREDSDVPVWDPEHAQMTVQSMLLRANGYVCDHAEVFFAETRTRHRVELIADADQWLTSVVKEIRGNAEAPTPPPPLIDSPKCPRCSLVSICLPDESNALHKSSSPRPRRLISPNRPQQPLYVVSPSASVRKNGERLVIRDKDETIGDCRLLDVSHVALYGNASISSGALRACLDRGVPILWFTFGGWYVGHAVEHGGSWVQRRVAQHRIAASDVVPFAQAFVRGKVLNQRTLLRRNGGESATAAVKELAGLAKKAGSASAVEDLLGIEGRAARSYFEQLPSLFTVRKDTFNFEGRNRRPPTDPANAALSFLYSLLARDAAVALIAAGLDPQVGFLHAPRFGRPSLALDLMEEFRPLVADSTLLTLVNNGELRESHFIKRGGRVGLTTDGRRAVISAYERRVGQELTHPMFKYRVSYRRAIELQARLLAAVIEGQFDAYRPLTTR